MPKIVRVKSSGEILYRQEPEFKKGKGLENAFILNPQYKSTDLKEVEITEEEWNQHLEILRLEAEREQKIQAEMRELAIKSLEAKGEL